MPGPIHPVSSGRMALCKARDPVDELPEVLRDAGIRIVASQRRRYRTRYAGAGTYLDHEARDRLARSKPDRTDPGLGKGSRASRRRKSCEVEGPSGESAPGDVEGLEGRSSRRDALRGNPSVH